MRNGIASSGGKGRKAGLAIVWTIGSRHEATSQGGAQLHVLRTNQVTNAVRLRTESNQHGR